MNLKNQAGKNNLHSTTSTEETKPALQSSTEGTEQELADLILKDQALLEQHKRMLLSTPGFEHLTDEEATVLTETLLQYTALIYEITKDQDPDYFEII